MDDYESRFAVYLLPDNILECLATMPWSDLESRGSLVGVIEVNQVVLDATKRVAMKRSLFNLIDLEH